MKTLAASLSILTREGVMLYLLRGVAFTCICLLYTSDAADD